MRDKMLGRWTARWAVTLGFGVVALGVGLAAAHSVDLLQHAPNALHANTLTVDDGRMVIAGPQQTYITEDFGWL